MSVPGVVSPTADRFYCPPPRRHLLDKQHKQHPPLTASAAEGAAKPTPEELRRDPFPSPATATTNLESFIASTAVRVPARCPPRVRPPALACLSCFPYVLTADGVRLGCSCALADAGHAGVPGRSAVLRARGSVGGVRGVERVRRRRAAAAQWHGRRRAVLRAIPLRYPALWVAAAAVKQEVV